MTVAGEAGAVGVRGREHAQIRIREKGARKEFFIYSPTNPSFSLFQLFHSEGQLLEESNFKISAAAVAMSAAPRIRAFSSKSNLGW